MIEASRSVEKPTENVKVPFDEYNKLSSISTKVDIIVDVSWNADGRRCFEDIES